jgi:hypothetical protein
MAASGPQPWLGVVWSENGIHYGPVAVLATNSDHAISRISAEYVAADAKHADSDWEVRVMPFRHGSP